MKNEITPNLERYKKLIIKSYNNFFNDRSDEVTVEMINKFNDSFSFEVGRVYIKVVVNRSVHSFIVISENDKKFAYGDILKPAGWSAPARNFKRANIFEPKSFASVHWTGI